MIAWLPIAGVLASTMLTPIMSQADVATDMQDQRSAAAVVPVVADLVAMPCHPSNDGDVSTETCNHCVLCHIAGAMVPPLLPVMVTPPIPDPEWLIDSVSFSSFIPEQPQRPPSSAGF